MIVQAKVYYLNNGLSGAIKSFIDQIMSFDPWTLLAHFICSIIIIGCIAKWVYKPTSDFIAANKKKLDKERRNLIVSTRETRFFLDLLKKERNEVFNIKRNVEMKARKEADQIVIDARTLAQESVEKMKQEAESKVRMMEEKAKDQIKDSVINLSMELTEKLVGANINNVNNQAIIDAYIKDLEDKRLVSSEKQA